MDPRDLPTVTKRRTNQTVQRFSRWVSSLSADTAFQDDEEAAVDGAGKDLSGPSASSPRQGVSRQLRRSDTTASTSHVVMSSNSAADSFLGTAARAGDAKRREQLPAFIIHPLDTRYRLWWYTTVVVAAITSLLEPYVIAFTPPGLYPYGSATSILEYLCIALILVDIFMSFSVARYVNGELITDRRLLARNYMRLIFWVDLISIIPFDELALAIAGLNGPNYVLNPVKAQYLSLLKIIRMVRMYRLSWFFSYLTYNLAAPLLLVTLARNLFMTFFLAHVAACTYYFEARQSQFGPDTWVGANSEWLEGSSISEMYIYSLYWSVVTLATVGFGDFRAFNAVEAGLMTFWVLFLFFFTAYIIGSITLLVVKQDERMGEYRDQMRTLQSYSTLHTLPDDLRESMLRHMKLHFFNSQTSDEKVLKSYPSTIRRRVLRQLYLGPLKSVYLFQKSRQRFMDALLAAARIELYLPDVEILTAGDQVNELFVVVAGSVVCQTLSPGDIVAGPEDVTLSPEDKSVYRGRSRVVGEGGVFGEVAFFTGTPQAESVVTASTVRVLTVPKPSYEKICQSFREGAREVLTQLDKQAEAAAVADFPGYEGKAKLARVRFLMRQSRSVLGGQAGAPPPTDIATLARAASISSAGGPLELTPGQEAGVSRLLRVHAMVHQFVTRHDEERVTEWLYAAARGDNAMLQQMLDHGQDVDCCDYDKRTALMLAASRGHHDTLELLLGEGAESDAVDAFGNTAIWEAVQGGHDDCVAVLKRRGSSTGKDGASQAFLLCNAVNSGDLQLLRRLLEAGYRADAADYDKRTPLHVAAAQGNLAAVELLVTVGGATVDVKDRWGNSPASEAGRVKAQAVVAFLKQEEVDGTAQS